MIVWKLRPVAVRCVVFALSVLFVSAGQAETPKPNPIYNSSSGKVNIKRMPRPMAFSAQDTTPGSSCSLITFEGLGDLAAIPDFYGVSLPDWLSVIENNAGGSGNFSGEPSPVTIAFWLSGGLPFNRSRFPTGRRRFRCTTPLITRSRCRPTMRKGMSSTRPRAALTTITRRGFTTSGHRCRSALPTGQ